MAPHSPRLGILVAAIAMSAAARLEAQSSPPQIPIRAGATIVSAVLGDSTRQDYEQVVSIASATGGELTLRAFAEFEERSGRRRQVSVTRRVISTDIAGAPVQILGFNTADAASLPGRRRLARRSTSCGRFARRGAPPTA